MLFLAGAGVLKFIDFFFYIYRRILTEISQIQDITRTLEENNDEDLIYYLHEIPEVVDTSISRLSLDEKDLVLQVDIFLALKCYSDYAGLGNRMFLQISNE